MEEAASQNRCELCGRGPLAVTRHHLIPRATHRHGQTRRQFDKAEMQGRIALLCRSCHGFIHRVLSERELTTGYNTLEALRQHPEIEHFLAWISKKPSGFEVKSARLRQR